VRRLSLWASCCIVACPYRNLAGWSFRFHCSARSSSLVEKMVTCRHLSICFAHHIRWRWHLRVWYVLACFKSLTYRRQFAHTRNTGRRNPRWTWIYDSGCLKRSCFCRWFIFYPAASRWCRGLQGITTFCAGCARLRWVYNLFFLLIRNCSVKSLSRLINWCLLPRLGLNKSFCLKHLRLHDLLTLMLL